MNLFFENFGRVFSIFVGTKLSTTLLLYVITISILIQSSWITSHSSNNLLHFFYENVSLLNQATVESSQNYEDQEHYIKN
jgi:hypothetical protein